MKNICIKICGFTIPDEAVAAAYEGVDAIGLVFAKSPRQVSLSGAADIVRVLPPLVQTVGVFVNESVDGVRRVVDECGIDMVQLHGDEDVSYCGQFPGRVIKAFRVRSHDDIEKMLPYEDVVRGFLLDAWAPDAAGGTGRRFDWSIALDAVARLSRPVILAGGLTPENVREAVETVSPWGVDASSGVEKSPGRKDIRKIGLLVKQLGRGG
jgi:phosphoribosylanthranilate isomerase